MPASRSFSERRFHGDPSRTTADDRTGTCQPPCRQVPAAQTPHRLPALDTWC